MTHEELFALILAGLVALALKFPIVKGASDLIIGFICRLPAPAGVVLLLCLDKLAGQFASEIPEGTDAIKAKYYPND